MKEILLYKHQLARPENLYNNEVMKEYYNLSRFLQNSTITDSELDRHLREKIISFTSDEINSIEEAANRVVKKLDEIDCIIEEAFPEVKVEAVLIIGDGHSDGHGILVNGRPMVVIDIGTISNSIDFYDLDAFLIHEIIHAIHYYSSPEFYFSNYKGITDKYFKRTMAEGLATFISGEVHPNIYHKNYWLGFLSNVETEKWIEFCKQHRESISKELEESIKANSINEDLYYQLFSVTDPENLYKSRIAYFYGSEICKYLSRKVGYKELLEVEVNEWLTEFSKYFNLEYQ